MSSRGQPPASYMHALLTELDGIRAAFTEILDASDIINIDPYRHSGDGIAFIGYPEWGWAAGSPALEAARMALLQRVREWEPRFRLLFPHPTPTVKQRLDEHIGRLKRWLVREKGEHGVPSTVEKAAEVINASVANLHALTELLRVDDYVTRLAVDTNTLIDNPDLTAHVDALGSKYMVHLLPVVLREIDDLKRGGRTPDLRSAAQRADRRLKGLRTNGDARAGVRVAGDVCAIFEHVEPNSDGLPSWLDLTVPDDRFVASSLLLQSAHPGSTLYVATSDINLQTKLTVVGLPFVELPPY